MKKSKFKKIILEAYEETLLEFSSKLNESLVDEIEDTDRYNVKDNDYEVSQDGIRPLDIQEEDEPKPEEPGEEKGAVLEDATDKILSKFPTLKAALIKLQTEDFKQFVESIDWVSPRPTSFRINLKNGQDFILKWQGEGFEANILGKRYYLNKIDDYQQALDKLEVLYREAPMKGAGEDEEGADFDSGGSSGGGGGDFPGEEGGGDAGGDKAPEAGGEEGGADLSDEPVDFEAGEEPEA